MEYKMESKTESKIEEIWIDKHGRNFIRSEEAASEIIGHMLILGITVMAVSIVLLYSLPMIQDLKEDAIFKGVQQAFTIIDMRTSGVVSEESISQKTSFDIGGGSLTVLPNDTDRESYINIIGENEAFNINIPMGKLKYSIGDKVVAYEGGGLWDGYGDRSIMMSAPQLYYSGDTLTISQTNISGSSSQGGKGFVSVDVERNPKDPVGVLFPVGGNKSNPMSSSGVETVYMNITSDYYRAWGEYIGSMIDEEDIVVDHGNRTVTAEFTVGQDDLGERISPIPDPIKIKGLSKKKINPLKRFIFRIYSSNEFREFNWDIRGKIGDKTLIFHIFKTKLSIGYQEGDLEGETWDSYTYPIMQDEIGHYIDVDLLDNNTILRYSDENVGSDNAVGCQPFGTKIRGLSDPDYSWNDLVITPNNENKYQSIYNITQHYISRMAREKGDVLLYQCSPGGGHDPELPSSIIIDYDTGSNVLRFLYVSDNRININIS